MTMGDIHSRIKELREQRGLSMESLAKLIGVSWQTIQQWEKQGGTSPKRARLELVAEKLGISSYYLLTGNYEPHAEATNIKAFQRIPELYTHPNQTIAEVIRILEGTDETGRLMALGAVKAALSGYAPAKANPAS